MKNALFLLAFFPLTTFAVPISYNFADPIGDQTGHIDVSNMLFSFENTTGVYEIDLTATSTDPFVGNFRVNVNIFNIDLGTTSQDPTFFSDVVNDFNLVSSTTSLTLTGTNSRLTQWNPGDTVLVHNLLNPDGTLPGPSPDDVSFFRTAVNSFPLSYLTNEDTIGFINAGSPGKVPAPAAIWLLGIGMIGLGFARRKQRPGILRSN